MASTGQETPGRAVSGGKPGLLPSLVYRGPWAHRPGVPVWLLLRPGTRGLPERVRCGSLQDRIPVNPIGWEEIIKKELVLKETRSIGCVGCRCKSSVVYGLPSRL